MKKGRGENLKEERREGVSKEGREEGIKGRMKERMRKGKRRMEGG